MDFNFSLGKLDREGMDELLVEIPDPDTPIVVGRLSAASGTSTALFPLPLSSVSPVTGGLSLVSKLDCFIQKR
jgi:hypothetical protein